MKKFLQTLLALNIFLMLAIPVLAASPQFYAKNLTITDPTVPLEIPRGEAYKIEFSVGNLDADRAATIKFKISNIDQSQLKEAMPIPKEWVRYIPNENISINAGEEKKVTLVITPPEDATMGAYKFIVSSALIDYEGSDSSENGIGAVMSPAIGNKISIIVGEGTVKPAETVNENSTSDYSYYVYVAGFIIFIIVATLFWSRLKKKS